MGNIAPVTREIWPKHTIRVEAQMYSSLLLALAAVRDLDHKTAASNKAPYLVSEFVCYSSNNELN